MLPSPLLPAVVHFPIVFAVLLPIAALFALWVIRRGAAPLRAWAFPLAIAVGLTGSASVALQTGEAEEERVEAYVAEAAIHEHEEAAERFLLVAGVVTLIAGAGLLSGVLGSAARLVATAGAVIVLAAGVQIGRAGVSSCTSTVLPRRTRAAHPRRLHAVGLRGRARKRTMRATRSGVRTGRRGWPRGAGLTGDYPSSPDSSTERVLMTSPRRNRGFRPFRSQNRP